MEYSKYLTAAACLLYDPDFPNLAWLRKASLLLDAIVFLEDDDKRIALFRSNIVTALLEKGAPIVFDGVYVKEIMEKRKTNESL